MLLGVFVHAETLIHISGLGVFGEISNHFRMATFFLASGILAGLILERRSAGAYIQSRFLNLGLPLAAGLLFLNPPALWLIFQHHNTDISASMAEVFWASFMAEPPYSGPLIWHLHLWFLFSLLAMATLAPALFRSLRSPSISHAVSAVLKALPERVHGLALATITVALVVSLRIVFEVIAPNLNDIWLVNVTLTYLPVFCSGLLIFTQPALWKAVNRIDPLLIGAAIAVLLVQHLVGTRLPETFATLLEFTVLNFVRAAAAITLIAVFAAFANRASKVTSLLTNSIYTVYLLHFLLVYAITAFLSQFDIDVSGIVLLLVCMITICIGLATHVFLVARVPMLELIFNGKRPRLASS